MSRVKPRGFFVRAENMPVRLGIRGAVQTAYGWQAGAGLRREFLSRQDKFKTDALADRPDFLEQSSQAAANLFRPLQLHLQIVKQRLELSPCGLGKARNS